MRILGIAPVRLRLLRPTLLLRIPVPAAISLSGVAVWLLSGMSGLRRHFLLWHRGLLLWGSLLLNGRLLRLGLLGFPHHCEEISLSNQLLLLVKPFVDSLQVAGFGVLACLGKRVHGLLVSLGGDMLLCLLEILLILLALLPVLFGFFRLGFLSTLAL